MALPERITAQGIMFKNIPFVCRRETGQIINICYTADGIDKCGIFSSMPIVLHRGDIFGINGKYIYIEHRIKSPPFALTEIYNICNATLSLQLNYSANIHPIKLTVEYANKNMLFDDTIENGRLVLSDSEREKHSRRIAYGLKSDAKMYDGQIQEGGWVNTNLVYRKFKFREGFYATFDIFMDIINSIGTGGYTIYQLSDDMTKIRARQGHKKTLGLKKVVIDSDMQKPPPFLLHGTTEDAIPSICAEGLKTQTYVMVYLTNSYQVAINVASRQDKMNKVLVIDTSLTNTPFYRTSDTVWAVDFIPPEAIVGTTTDGKHLDRFIHSPTIVHSPSQIVKLTVTEDLISYVPNKWSPTDKVIGFDLDDTLIKFKTLELMYDTVVEKLRSIRGQFVLFSNQGTHITTIERLEEIVQMLFKNVGFDFPVYMGQTFIMRKPCIGMFDVAFPVGIKEFIYVGDFGGVSGKKRSDALFPYNVNVIHPGIKTSFILASNYFTDTVNIVPEITFNLQHIVISEEMYRNRINNVIDTIDKNSKGKPVMIMMMGFPGSGKSTFAKELQKVLNETKEYKYIAYDDMTPTEFTSHVKNALAKNESFIVDRTFLSKSMRDKVYKYVKGDRYVIAVYLEGFEEAMYLANLREMNGGVHIPAVAFHALKKSYEEATDIQTIRFPVAISSNRVPRGFGVLFK